MTTTTRTLCALGALLLVATTLATAQTDPTPPPPCSSEEYRQFDFWVGDWVVTGLDGSTLGTNLIEKSLNGCVLVENWLGSDGSIGRSFNMFFGNDGKWHQTWVDGNGGRLDLAGGWKKEKMVLSGSMPGRDGKPVMHEVSWTPQTDGTVRQHWRASKDRGKDWQDLFVGTYSRRSTASK